MMQMLSDVRSCRLPD